MYNGTLTDTSDQYSLAVTYYVLRTGRFPFPPQPVQGPPVKSVFQSPPELAGVSQGEKAALGRALAIVPQARFPTCRDLMTCLIRANGLKVIWTDEGTWKIVKDEDTMVDGPKTEADRTAHPPRRTSR